MRTARLSFAVALTVALATLSATAGGPGAGSSAIAPLPPHAERVLAALRRARPAVATMPAPAVLPSPAAAAAATTFARAYGGPESDTAYLAKVTADGGFIISGDTDSFGAGEGDAWLFKIDGSGSIVWQKTFGTAGGDIGMLESTSDGGFILGIWTSSQGGGGNPFTLVKLTEAGAISWQKSYGTADDTFSAVEVITGGYLLLATRADYQTQQFTDILVKLDTNGNIVWQRSYASGALHSGFGQQLSDGSFIVSGTLMSLATGDSDMFLTKLNSSGVIQWQKVYGGEGYDGGTYALPTSDGGFVYVGMTQSFGVNAGDDEHFDAWVVKLDSAGNPQWGTTYGGANDEFGTVMPITGGYLLTGVTDSFGAGGDDLFMSILSSTGVVSWAKAYGGANDELGSILPDSSGGGYLIQSATDSWGAGNDDFWLAKLDASGNFSWQRAYGGGNDEFGMATRLSDGGLLITGDTKSWGAGAEDAWVVRVGSTGALAAPAARDLHAAAACSFVTDTTAQATSFSFSTSPALPTVTTDDLVESTPSYTSSTAAVTVLTPAATVTDLCSAAQNLAAAATADKTSGAAPLTVTFTGSATGGTSPYTYSWDFGDGDSSSSQSPSHTYSNGGTYSVTLTVTDNAGATATDTHLTITVTGGGGTCTVSCSTTVPTAGTAGQAIPFAVTATVSNCTGPAAYMWTFGDATLPSTQQNPTHTFATPGTYTWNLMVTAGTGFCLKTGSITISAGGTCTFQSCTATVPTTGAAGQAVAFASTLTSSNCTGSPTYAWTFGDGGTATTQNPSHTYSAAGGYSWSFTVSQSGQSCSKSGTISISGGGGSTNTYWIPSIAHAPGAGGSKWRSNVAVVNRSGSTASLTLLFVPYAAGSTVTKSHTLANGATVEWTDVLVSLFLFADSANTKGTVKITSDRAIVAMARTYNQAASGTFGQYYPALVVSQGISSSQAAVLPLLKKNTAFRANVGFQNLGPDSCSGEVKLFNAAGAQVGSTRTLTAAGDKYIQEDDVFTKAGAGTQNVAYARVQPTTAGCKAWFFGSVVDAVTNDPTTVPQQLSQAGPFWIPSIAHAPGAGTSKWRSNIAVVNRSGSTATLTLVFTPYGAGSTVTRSHTLANNATVEWADVLVSLFGFADSANAKGSVKITADKALFAMARTYNQADTGTFGQYYPALVAADAITSGQSAVLPLLKKNTGFRTNTGFQNLGTASCTGTVKLFNAAGAQVGSTRTLTAATDKYIQEDDVFAKAGAGTQDVAYALVEVTTAAGQAWFFGSVIDAVTNDPTTIPQQR